MAFVTLEKQDHIGILTINRPEALNALNSQVLSDLDAAIKRAFEEAVSECKYQAGQ